RLPPPEDIEQPWPSRIHAGAHGEPGENDERKQYEENREVAQFLQGRVTPPMPQSEPGVVECVTWQAGNIRAPGNDIAAKMPVDEARKKPDKQSCNEYPAEEEVHDAPSRQIAKGRNGHGARKADIFRPFCRP